MKLTGSPIGLNEGGIQVGKRKGLRLSLIEDEEGGPKVVVTLRASKALERRTDAQAKTEKRSVSRHRALLLEGAADFFEWMAAHQTRIDAFKRSEGLKTFSMILIRLAELGLSAWEKERSRR
jgi:hypothetical protein